MTYMKNCDAFDESEQRFSELLNEAVSKDAERITEETGMPKIDYSFMFGDKEQADNAAVSAAIEAAAAAQGISLDDYDEEDIDLESIIAMLDEIDMLEADESANDKSGRSNDDEFNKIDIDKGKKKSGFGRTFVRVAAIVLLFFVAVMGTSIWLVSEPASAAKFKIERKLYQLKDNYFSTNDSVEMDFTDENSISVTITNLEDITVAENLVTYLPSPNYMPKGSEFVELLLEKYYTELYQGTYKYEYDNGKNATITVVFRPDSQQSIKNLDEVDEIIEYENKTIIVFYDLMNDLYSATVLYGDGNLSANIVAPFTKDEIKKVAEELI